ncbi:MAG: T9SS type A sorting domain-containing protein [Bacteroidetes bacterium]|nr:MAG: T9SS type A sorting domain-containing protein [Bacteroidota bacterium]
MLIYRAFFSNMIKISGKTPLNPRAHPVNFGKTPSEPGFAEQTQHNMKNNTRLFTLLTLLAFLPLVMQAQNCQTPISATLGTAVCDDNGTPLDSLDDTYTYTLNVSGDSTTWSVEPDSLLYLYDSTYTFGPLAISGGAMTVVVINTSDSLCTDTVMVVPPSPCSVPPPMCQAPISASVDSIACDDNGTPLDSLDDTYTFFLTVTGDSTSWSILGDSVTFPYDTAVLSGPHPISGGVLDVIVVNTSDSVCMDTVMVTPPAPCSVPPVCQTPITAIFADVSCDDNGTPLDSLDDTFSFMLMVMGGDSTWGLAGDSIQYPYDSVATIGNYLITNGPVTVVAVDNTDGLCTDTVTVMPPAPCSVPLTACDVKEIGCMRYELLSITHDSSNHRTYTFQVINNCPNKMIYTAFQVPDGTVAEAPDDNTVYTAPSGREYLVRSPNFTPIYSVRFKSTADSIADGQSDIFEYTLQPQSAPDYILAVTRVAPKIFYQAHLNTFGCKDSLTQMVIIPTAPNDPGPKADPNVDPNGQISTVPGGTFTVYPNPTTGPVMVDIQGWKGQTLQLQLLNLQGSVLKTVSLQASTQAQTFDLPTGLDAGVYYLKLIPATGAPVIQQLVIQW